MANKTDRYAEYVRTLPELTAVEMAAYLASKKPCLIHSLVQHDDDCPAAGTGKGCVCEPVIAYHLQT